MNIGYNFLGYCFDGDTTFVSEFTKIGKSLEGINSPDKVTFRYKNRDYIGYLKSDDSEFNNNSLEFVLYQISKLLHIELAKNIRVYSDSSYVHPTAIVSVNVADGANKKLVSFREMRDELFVDLQNGLIPNSKWIKNWVKIRARKIKDSVWEIPALQDSEYVDCLQFPFEIARLWCNKHGLKLEELSHSLAQMVCFDILIGQTDRSPSNYGLLVDHITRSAKLAPLFDNATITKPYISLSQNSFNQLILQRKKLAYIAKTVLRQDFEQSVKCCYSRKHDIDEMIQNYKGHLSPETYSLFKSRINEGMGLFEELYSLY